MINGLIKSKEYAKNRFKITCTSDYFSKKLDHNILNNHHYFIDVVFDIDKFCVYLPVIRLTYANSVKDEAFSLPVQSILKDGTIVLDDLSFVKNEIEQIIEENKLWQIEIAYSNHLYVITAPKLKKYIFK